MQVLDEGANTNCCPHAPSRGLLADVSACVLCTSEGVPGSKCSEKTRWRVAAPRHPYPEHVLGYWAEGTRPKALPLRPSYLYSVHTCSHVHTPQRHFPGAT